MIVLNFETHPIQYRTPVYERVHSLVPHRFEVVFGSDFSVRGYCDEGFQASIAWDNIRLDAFPHQVLHQATEGKLKKRLWEPAIDNIIRTRKPAAVLVHSLNDSISRSAMLSASLQRIPIWVRTEAEDDSRNRSVFKSWVRSCLYRQLYSRIDRFFTIGRSNVQHYLRHGVHESQMRSANYCTSDPCQGMSDRQKWESRKSLRQQLSIDGAKIVVAFFGKLIPKKNPDIILKALRELSSSQRAKLHLLVVGSGELEESLRKLATAEEISHSFVGFINQSSIGRYYLASDILVLPSRRMGETWGLVVNEALQCGCSVITSDAVGCHMDFEQLENFRVFPVGNAPALAGQIRELSNVRRDFNWATPHLQYYSVESAAQAIASEIASLIQ